MSLFGNVTRNDNVEPETDSLGGFSRLESGVYDFVVEMAYAVEAQSGAKGLFLQLMGGTGQPLRETLYVTSGTEKGGKNYFTDRNGKDRYLPGFVLANDLCIAITGKELSEQKGAEKEVKVTSWVDNKPVEGLEKKQVLLDLIGAKISLGILKVLEDGHPVTTNSRERNSIDKVFVYGSRLTIVEKEAGLTEGVFIDKWVERNAGKTQDKRVESKGSDAGTAGAPAATAAGATAPSLFE